MNTEIERESMEYDVIIVGAGPAGLSAAIKIMQLANEREKEISVCVVEKGAEVGAHILSGAILEPTALNELIPDWQEKDAPIKTAVTKDEIMLFRSQDKSIKVPGIFAPKTMHNDGNYIISLGMLCRWLAEQAETLGVDIFPGFPASEVLYNENNDVIGIITGDMGVGSDGEAKDSFTPGMELHAKYTLFSEGCRGHLGKQLIEKFELSKGKDPQHYGIGIKELWEVPAEQHQPGLVVHSAGWPLSESNSSGGGFLYHLEDNLVAVGLITDLSYENTYLNPYEEFQRYKHQKSITKHLTNGKRISYGARALLKGGIQSQPKLYFKGGALIGDDAGTLNAAKIKGTHTAMKSGMCAAEAVVNALSNNRANDELSEFQSIYENSWAYKELYTQRNFAPAQHKWGNLLGSAYAFIDINIFNGKLPWTLKDSTADFAKLKKTSECQPIDYPKPDGKLSFDKASSVYISGTNHEENQPVHLTLKDNSIPIKINLADYNAPEQRYCPAGVYEIVEKDNEPALQINAQNCVHCKTCDIKDVSQNINWIAPEGGGGPAYSNM